MRICRDAARAHFLGNDFRIGGNSDGHGYTNRDGSTFTNSDCDSHGDGYRYGDSNGYCGSQPDNNRNAKRKSRLVRATSQSLNSHASANR